MGFWIVALLLSLLALGWLARPFLWRGSDKAARSSYDIQIYKDQLREIDNDLARGVLTDAEANASRTEISRRLLSAADKAETESYGTPAPKAVSTGMVAVIVAMFIGGGALYSKIGAPGYSDLPLVERIASRPSQAEAETVALAAQGSLPLADPKHIELIEQLSDALKDRPNDLTGHRMLADNLAQLGRFVDARVAQDKVIAILGDQASAEDFASQAEIMIIAADWYISPEAETALANSIQQDDTNPRARFYIGLALWQRGQPAQTYQLWSGLKDEGHEAVWMTVLNAELAAVAAEAGITRGPTDADIDAAANMSDEERFLMIQNMVSNLSDRLATEGGTPEEWAQLIRALGALGETEQATAIWVEAQSVFADNETAIAVIQSAASVAGISE